jgi:RimJ/RimL family protein N-acetyltransferase
MVLNGQLIRLRPFERPDLDLLLRWRNDLEVTEFLSTLDMSAAEAELWFWRYVGTPNAYFYVIEVGDTPIGCVGIRGINRRAQSGILDIVIGEKAEWGHGYGTDAVHTIVAHAFGALGLESVTLEVLPFNERAIRAYERCGFRVTGTNTADEYDRRGRRWRPLEMRVTRAEFPPDVGRQTADGSE